MKKLFLCIILIALLNSCAGKNDVLATFKGGSITRGEMYAKIKESNLPIESFRKNRAYQQKELKMIAVDRIAVIEAEKEGYDKTERFTFLMNDVKNKYLGAYLLESIIDKKGFKEKIVNVSHIVLKIPSKEPGDISRVRMQANEIIEKLDKGMNFGDLAKKYSIDLSRSHKGNIGFILYDIFPEEYAKAAFSLHAGEYTVEPVYVKERDRIFIIKVNEIKVLRPDNLYDIIEDRKVANSYKKLIYRKIKTAYGEELKNAKDATLNTKAMITGTGNTPVFTIDKKVYTKADINKRIAMIEELSRQKISKSDTSTVETIVRDYFQNEILKREALKQNIDKEEKFIQKISSLKESYLAGDYLENLTTKDIVITEKDLRNEYNVHKDKKYATYQKRGDKKIKIIPSFNEVKERMIFSIENARALEKRAKWIQEKLEEYNFTINEDELEGI